MEINVSNGNAVFAYNSALSMSFKYYYLFYLSKAISFELNVGGSYTFSKYTSQSTLMVISYFGNFSVNSTGQITGSNTIHLSLGVRVRFLIDNRFVLNLPFNFNLDLIKIYEFETDIILPDGEKKL